jgi:predicted alpha/beta superfamily hydrolase
VCFKQFDDENHASVVPAAISRALRFALAARR